MTPEDLVKQLRQASGSTLKSVILYGSAAAGDHVGRRSDYNVLVVMEKLDLDDLKALSKPARQWIKAGNPAPLFLTVDRLHKSTDVFPIEIVDIKQSHRVLFGPNIVDELQVDPENLRLELERELKSKLIQLRDRFLMTGGKASRVLDLMIESLSTFLVLFRAALRLFQDDAPRLKINALQELHQHISFDKDVFLVVAALKEGEKKAREVDAERLFDRYLKTVEGIADAIDSHIHATVAESSGGEGSGSVVKRGPEEG